MSVSAVATVLPGNSSFCCINLALDSSTTPFQVSGKIEASAQTDALNSNRSSACLISGIYVREILCFVV